METNIISVKYEDNFYPKTFCGREYSYYSDIEVSIGDIVEAPTKYGTSVALVTSINIPYEKVEAFKDNLKTITVKLNKELFLNESILQPAV